MTGPFRCAVHFDPVGSDQRIRRLLLSGDIVVISPRPAALGLCELGRELAEAAFAPYDPREAQFHLHVEQYAGILSELKPRFIHHPQAKQWIRLLLDELEWSPHDAFFDVPRLRTATHGGYLTSGLAYAYHQHRDTWYSAPHCQVNWWLPVYEINSQNTLSILPGYWNRPLKNTSAEFDFERWKSHDRPQAHQQIHSDSRKQPEAVEPIDEESELRIVSAPGSMILFSAAHLHGTVTNDSGLTRLSIDFRTVHRDDLLSGHAAPNVDSRCTGSTLPDFLNAVDFQPIDPQLVARAEQGSSSDPRPATPQTAVIVPNNH